MPNVWSSIAIKKASLLNTCSVTSLTSLLQTHYLYAMMFAKNSHIVLQNSIKGHSCLIVCVFWSYMQWPTFKSRLLWNAGILAASGSCLMNSTNLQTSPWTLQMIQYHSGQNKNTTLHFTRYIHCRNIYMYSLLSPRWYTWLFLLLMIICDVNGMDDYLWCQWYGWLFVMSVVWMIICDVSGMDDYLWCQWYGWLFVMSVVWMIICDVNYGWLFVMSMVWMIICDVSGMDDYLWCQWYGLFVMSMVWTVRQRWFEHAQTPWSMAMAENQRPPPPTHTITEQTHNTPKHNSTHTHTLCLDGLSINSQQKRLTEMIRFIITLASKNI